MSKTKKNEPDRFDLETIVRQMIIESGRSQHSIASESGVSPTQLSRFVRAERSLTLPAVSKLAKSLRFTIVKV